MANDREQIGVEYRGTGFYASVVAVLVIGVGLLAFAIQNTGSVTVEWLWFDVTAPLFAWVIGAALLAVIIDELIGLIWRARERSRLNRLEQHRRLADEAAAGDARESSSTQAETEAESPSQTSDLTQQAHDYDASGR
ncbi:MAG TPA: LapA family protein [Acidimicrobiia bacterium]|nr:LapA family protein [Acidimicrobiia bacterium]